VRKLALIIYPLLLVIALIFSGCSDRAGRDAERGSINDVIILPNAGHSGHSESITDDNSFAIILPNADHDVVSTDIGDVINLTNAERADAGLPAFDTDPLLSEFAAIRAREIAIQTSEERTAHIRPDGMTATTWVLSEGDGRFIAAGENIALGTAGFFGAEEVVAGWMGSPGHRANILRGQPGDPYNFNLLGVGFYYDGINYHWVQLFAYDPSLS